ncbi:hypothetical protein K1719_041914 [Acacia pycnantha]|nr:hypothetical protein K1719_041914 [Acacia pycnantha]
MYVEKWKMKKTSGIKSKQMLVWVSNTEMFMEQTNPDKIVFKTPVGIGKSSDHFLYDQRNRRTTTFKNQSHNNGVKLLL